MNQEVPDEVVRVVRELFGIDGEVRADLLRSDVPRWDSLKHVSLVDTLEQVFDVQLSMDEMIEIQGVADILRVLKRHQAL